MSTARVDDLDRYLLRGEQIVVAVHRHWATVAEPVTTALVLLLVVVWFGVGVDPRFGRIVDVLWWVWFAALARALFMLYEWRREWFVATDRRLLLIYGFIIRKVDMMPLGKVTDMTYHRTVGGRILGYGTFVLESAGQDQALSNVGFIPHPDETYRAMIAQIFHREGDEVEAPANGAYEEEVALEEDPTRRSALSRRLARLAPAGDRDRAETTGRERRWMGETPAPDVAPARGHEGEADDPPTESLWQGKGEPLYTSDPVADRPVIDYPDDTTGWWGGRRR